MLLRVLANWAAVSRESHGAHFPSTFEEYSASKDTPSPGEVTQKIIATEYRAELRSVLIQHTRVPQRVDATGDASEKIIWSIEETLRNPQGELGQTNSNMSLRELRDLPHEAVCHLLFGSSSGSTNVSEKDVWLESPPSPKITPDFFYQSENGTCIWAEVKTTRGRAKNKLEDAIRQYSDVVTSCRPPTHLLIVCVSPDEIIIGMEHLRLLHNLDSQLICDVLAVAQDLQDQSVRMGVPPGSLNQDTAKLIVIPEISLDAHPQEKLLISEEMIKQWDKLPSRDQLSESMIETAKTDSSLTSRFCGKLPRTRAFTTVKLIKHGPYLVSKLNDKSSASEIPTSAIFNPILRELMSKIVSSGWEGRLGETTGKKHVYLSGELGHWLDLSRADFCHGLWGTVLDPKQKFTSVFRSNGKRTERRSVWTAEGMNPKDAESFHRMGMTRDLRDELMVAQAEKRKKQQKKNFPLSDHDLSSWADQWVSDKLPEGKDWGDLEPEMMTVEGKKFRLPYQEEPWFRHVHFWQRLCEEINIGRYSARGAWNRFHFQTIHPYRAFLFTHGSGPDSHQFYYCIAQMEVEDEILGDWEELGGGWYYTRVVQSLRSEKLGQYLNILERLVSLRKYWSGCFPQNQASARRHFFASLAIAIEAKQATIDMLSNFRYAYMELCKESTRRDTLKVLNRLPGIFRTPVQAWVAARMIRLCTTSPDTPDTSEENPELNFKHLISWVDGERIPKFSTILSLSYMHYSSTHPVALGLHGKVAILEKLMKEELKLPSDRKKIGWSSPSLEDIGDHEFSVGYVKHLAEYASYRVKKIYPTWAEFLTNLSSELLSLRFSDFATFKKSTAIDHEDPAKRNYCFEEIQKLFGRLGVDKNLPNFSPYELLSEVVALQHKEKSCNVSIFVKDQQTGVREIFVLPIVLRILIKLMEVMSRMINCCLPNETLSTPSLKEDLVKTHRILVQKRAKELMDKVHGSKSPTRDKKYRHTTLRFCSSSDAKTWCQQFCMPTFGVFIWHLLSKTFGEESAPLRKMIMFILNQITNKRIQIDKRMKEWAESADIEETDNIVMHQLLYRFNKRYQEIYDQQVELGEKREIRNLISRDGSVINLTNMMQGIPHETSSSLHASYLMDASDFIVNAIEKFSKELPRCIILGKPVMTNMVSSDDSGIMFTLPIALELEREGGISKDSQTNLASLRSALSRLGFALEECKPLFGARVSYEKSTIFAETPVFEFNSRFFVGTSVHTAEIKFCTAPLTLGFHSSIKERIDEALSSLSGLVEQGLDQSQLYLMQFLLQRIHLRYLYINRSDPQVIGMLNELQLPSLGMVPAVRQGLVGILNSSLMCDYLQILNHPAYPLHALYNKKPGWELEGGFSLALKVSSRYNALAARYRVSKDTLLREINSLEDGPLLYLERRLGEWMQIRLKLATPGARVSMAFVDLCKIHMASCYAATTKCIGTGIPDEEKMTLLECLEKVRKMMGEPQHYPVASEENHQIKRLVQMLDESVEAPKIRGLRTTSWCRLSPSDSIHRSNLRSVLIQGWSRGFGRQAFSALTWAKRFEARLDHDLETCLGNFKGNVFELDRALFHLDEKTKIVRTVGLKPQGSGFTEFFSSLFESNWSAEKSLIIKAKVRMQSDPMPDPDSNISRHFSNVIEHASMCAWSFRCLRKHYTSAYRQVRDSWFSCLGEGEKTLGMSHLVCLCSGSAPQCLVDIRNLRGTRTGNIVCSETKRFYMSHGYWYVIETHKGTSIVKREKNAPELDLDCRQVVADSVDFLFPSKSLKMFVDLSSKRLVVKFDCATTIPNPQEDTREIYHMQLPGLSVDSFIALCPGTKVERMFIGEILRRLTSAGELMSRWSFWKSLSQKEKASGTTPLIKRICSELILVAQEDLKSLTSHLVIPEGEMYKLPTEGKRARDQEDGWRRKDRSSPPEGSIEPPASTPPVHPAVCRKPDLSLMELLMQEDLAEGPGAGDGAETHGEPDLLSQMLSLMMVAAQEAAKEELPAEAPSESVLERNDMRNNFDMLMEGAEVLDLQDEDLSRLLGVTFDSKKSMNWRELSGWSHRKRGPEGIWSNLRRCFYRAFTRKVQEVDPIFGSEDVSYEVIVGAKDSMLRGEVMDPETLVSWAPDLCKATGLWSEEDWEVVGDIELHENIFEDGEVIPKYRWSKAIRRKLRPPPSQWNWEWELSFRRNSCENEEDVSLRLGDVRFRNNPYGSRMYYVK